MQRVRSLPGQQVRGGGRRESRLELERRPLSRGALHADPSPHQAHKVGADGEAEPGATEAPARGSIGLGEGLEDPLVLSRLDADAGVGDDEAQELLRLPLGGRERERDPPSLRELQGVVQEVHQHLAQPPAIADHAIRNAVRHVAEERYALALGAGRQHAKRLAHEVRQGEGRFFQLELLRLDPRQVQHVAQERPKLVRR